MARNLPKFKDEETRLLIKVYATKESYKARYPYTNGNSFLQKVVGALVSAGYEEKTLGQLNNKIAYMKRHYKHQLKIVQDGGVSHWKFFEDMKRDRWNNFDENISVKQERSSPELQDPVPTTSRASTQVLDLSSKQKRKFYDDPPSSTMLKQLHEPQSASFRYKKTRFGHNIFQREVVYTPTNQMAVTPSLPTMQTQTTSSNMNQSAPISRHNPVIPKVEGATQKTTNEGYSGRNLPKTGTSSKIVNQEQSELKELLQSMIASNVQCLDVGTRRLNVETQRLDVEAQRLEIERERLDLENKRMCIEANRLLLDQQFMSQRE